MEDDFPLWTFGLNDPYFRSQELRAYLGRRLDGFYSMKRRRRRHHRVIKSISYLRGIVRGASRHQIEPRGNLEVYRLASCGRTIPLITVINIVRNPYSAGKKSELQTSQLGCPPIATIYSTLMGSIRRGFPTSFFEHDKHEITLTVDNNIRYFISLYH